jgi:membrane associated rhomboid family serine protease
VKRLKYTLILVLLTSAFYFVFSSFFLFISNSTIYEFGFSVSNWVGLVTYPFLHVGLIHLLGNMFLLMAIGFVVEEKLNWKDYYALYFISAITAGIFFVMLSPNVILAGASAAIGGFLIPACLIDFRKTIAYILMFSLASMLIAPVITDAVTGFYGQSQKISAELEYAYNQTAAQKEQVVQNISALDDKFNRGEITITDYNRSKQELVQIADNLTKQQETVYANLNKTVATVSNLEEGIAREQTSKTSLIVHLFGSFMGLAYLAIFRRDIIWNSGYQVLRLERWLKKHLKSSKKRV